MIQQKHIQNNNNIINNKINKNSPILNNQMEIKRKLIINNQNHNQNNIIQNQNHIKQISNNLMQNNPLINKKNPNNNNQMQTKQMQINNQMKINNPIQINNAIKNGQINKNPISNIPIQNNLTQNNKYPNNQINNNKIPANPIQNNKFPINQDPKQIQTKQIMKNKNQSQPILPNPVKNLNNQNSPFKTLNINSNIPQQQLHNPLQTNPNYKAKAIKQIKHLQPQPVSDRVKTPLQMGKYPNKNIQMNLIQNNKNNIKIPQGNVNQIQTSPNVVPQVNKNPMVAKPQQKIYSDKTLNKYNISPGKGKIGNFYNKNIQKINPNNGQILQNPSQLNNINRISENKVVFFQPAMQVSPFPQAVVVMRPAAPIPTNF